MTEGRAIALIAVHDCKLLPSRSDVLIIVNERINFHYQCWISDLPDISEQNFISVITTGHTPKGVPSLKGAYRDYRR